jgi:superfamily I DNA and RNA helicase
MDSSGGVYEVQATAGSGKTQLALALLAQAHVAGKRAGYMCFNRPLADHMKLLVARTAPSAQVHTFHTWALKQAQAAGLLLAEPLDYGLPQTFATIAGAWLTVAEQDPADLDWLIIDESQDFDAAWVLGLMNRRAMDSRLYLLGDTNQALYPVESFELDDRVRVVCHDNFRSPRKLVHAINQLKLTAEPVVAAGELDGDDLDISQWSADDAHGLRATEEALQNLWRAGYKPEQVVVLSWHGREHSAVLKCERLAGYKTRRWLGAYTPKGEPVYSEGVLKVDSVHRYKGQSAAAVVLTGLDFEVMEPHHIRRLFVGMTRAQLKLVILASEAALAALLQRVDF